MRRAAAAVLPIALCAATACATARTGADETRLEGTALAGRPSPVLATRTLIPMRTLDLDPGLSLYDVVSRYWPYVLRPNVPVAGPVPRPVAGDPRGDIVGVYVGENFSGGQEQLRSIRSSAVSSIRRLSQSEEYIRFGRSHPGGALVITFR